ncbi:MAG: hypothetical protein EOM91_05185 [Sphingobacteriia bacterium]|nr:hypothetical protein [Sphingobacteriia bacterium]NCC38735.1 hypothetical protein [Gammaproteobacteria bacterium]
MKTPRMLAMTLAISGLAYAFGSVADDDFYGVIETRPANGHVGEWVIGGRTFSVTDRVRLNTDDGPLDVGVCVSVDVEGGNVEEIESEDAEDCARARPV